MNVPTLFLPVNSSVGREWPVWKSAVVILAPAQKYAKSTLKNTKISAGVVVIPLFQVVSPIVEKVSAALINALGPLTAVMRSVNCK